MCLFLRLLGETQTLTTSEPNLQTTGDFQRTQIGQLLTVPQNFGNIWLFCLLKISKGYVSREAYMVFNRLINCQLEFVKTKDTVLSALMYYVHVAERLTYSCNL